MALNNSGKISLGGSTAGESIAAELGLGATTQISLNDTAVRALSGVTTPLSTIVVPLNFWGKSSASSWIAKVVGLESSTTQSLLDMAICSDGNGNILLSSKQIPLSNTFGIAKFNSNGDVIFAKTVTSQNIVSVVAVYEPTTNTFTTTSGAQVPTYIRSTMLRFNATTGEYHSQFGTWHNFNRSGSGGSVKVLGGEYYWSGSVPISSSASNAGWERYDVNGNLLASNRWGKVSATHSEPTSDGTYIYRGFRISSSGFGFIKFDKSFNPIAGTTVSANSNSITVASLYDSANSQVVFAGGGLVATNNTQFPAIYWFDTSLNNLKQVKFLDFTPLTNNTTGGSAYAVTNEHCIDNQNNKYFIFSPLALSSSFVTNKFAFVKYDANRNFVYGRYITINNYQGAPYYSSCRTAPAGTTPPGNPMFVDGDYIYIAFSSASSSTTCNNYIAKLKKDGSDLGVFNVDGVDITISAYNAVETSTGFGWAAPSMLVSAVSNTASTVTVSAANQSVTTTKTSL